ncbi:hypothetical protein ACJIZ3_013097 [Penstemon smallii]|uniref:Uncharacterized protein n=1 Tax=Penstemon smallii TaxID=265156 RepID=A0ABD3USE0_9LAMI
MTSLVPLEHAIRAGNNDGAAILFPFTSRDPAVSDWSIGGIAMHLHSEERKNQRELRKEEIFVLLKERGEAAFERKDDWTAVLYYTQALFIKPNDAIVLSKRFRCWARMNRSKRALKDAIDGVRNANGLEHRNLYVAANLISALPEDQIAIGLEGKPDPEGYKAMQKAFD